MTNLSKFHSVFSSSSLICLNRYAFEGHFCQTINNFVKQNQSSIMASLRKGGHQGRIKVAWGLAGTSLVAWSWGPNPFLVGQIGLGRWLGSHNWAPVGSYLKLGSYSWAPLGFNDLWLKSGI